MDGDVFAAVEGCSMLFPHQGSHPPGARRSSRSRHAKWHLSFPVSALVCCSFGACAGQLEQPQSNGIVRELAKLTPPWGFPPVVPAPPPAGAKPLSHPAPSLRLAPALTPFPGTWWRNKVQWQKGKMMGQLERWRDRHPKLVCLQQLKESETYLSSKGNQVPSTWK